MAETSRHRSVADAARAWAARMSFVFGVFAVSGFVTSAVVFAKAPNLWLGSAGAAVAAGLGGATGWAVTCGRLPRPAWWRVAIAGGLGGVFLHPYFWFLGGCLSGRLPTMSEVLTGTQLSLMIVGIITIPAGVAASLCCRALAGRHFAGRRAA